MENIGNGNNEVNWDKDACDFWIFWPQLLASTRFSSFLTRVSHSKRKKSSICRTDDVSDIPARGIAVSVRAWEHQSIPKLGYRDSSEQLQSEKLETELSKEVRIWYPADIDELLHTSFLEWFSRQIDFLQSDTTTDLTSCTYSLPFRGRSCEHKLVYSANAVVWSFSGNKSLCREQWNKLLYVVLLLLFNLDKELRGSEGLSYTRPRFGLLNGVTHPWVSPAPRLRSKDDMNRNLRRRHMERLRSWAEVRCMSRRSFNFRKAWSRAETRPPQGNMLVVTETGAVYHPPT